MYVLDTDYLSLLKQASGKAVERLVERIGQHGESSFFITIVSFHEQVKGWQSYVAKAKGQSGVIRGYAELEGLLGDYANAQVLPYDDAASEVFEELRQQRIRVGTMDLRIAAIAIANGMTLLSRNATDFERVPGLVFDDWCKP